jgi:hypothetical protein
MYYPVVIIEGPFVGSSIERKYKKKEFLDPRIELHF